MPSLSVAVPHSLGPNEATRRLKDHFAQAKDRFGHQVGQLNEQWDGDVLSFGFTAFGVRVEGKVTSDETEVRVDAELPLMAMPFKGKIEQQIRDQLGKVLG